MTHVDDDLRAIAASTQVLARHLHRSAVLAIGLDPLPQSELEVTQHVSTHPGSSVSEVAHALRLQTSNVSTTVRSLVQRGLVERRADPRDQRRIHLWPSPTALEHRTVLEAMWSEMLARLLADLGADDEARLRAAAPALERLAAAVTAGAAPGPRSSGPRAAVTSAV